MNTVSDTFLMCKPSHFRVSYVINPWMDGNVDAAVQEESMRQWKELQSKIMSVAKVAEVKPGRKVPDMVFTANAAVVRGKKAVISRFKHPERQGEEALFCSYFLDNGFEVLYLPNGIPFEGAGDALFCRRHADLLWMGYGHRTDEKATSYLRDYFGVAVVSLKLVDDRFYHLDTCFCPLEGGYLMYYPQAFDELSLAKIWAMYPVENRIEVSEEDALNFSCNAVNCGRNIFLNKASGGLKDQLEALGFSVHETPLGEFMKAGGSAKCLTLRLNEE